jgi:hypothetical protein
MPSIGFYRRHLEFGWSLRIFMSTALRFSAFVGMDFLGGGISWGLLVDGDQGAATVEKVDDPQHLEVVA